MSNTLLVCTRCKAISSTSSPVDALRRCGLRTCIGELKRACSTPHPMASWYRCEHAIGHAGEHSWAAYAAKPRDPDPPIDARSYHKGIVDTLTIGAHILVALFRPRTAEERAVDVAATKESLRGTRRREPKRSGAKRVASKRGRK